MKAERLRVIAVVIAILIGAFVERSTRADDEPAVASTIKSNPTPDQSGCGSTTDAVE